MILNLGVLWNIPAVSASMLVLALDLAVTHAMANLLAVGTLDLHTILQFRTLLLATLPDMSQL